jgi:protein TonB
MKSQIKRLIFILILGFSAALKAQSNYSEILPPAEKGVAKANEQMPIFPGGEQALFKFLQDNILYPKEAKKMKLTGKVFVKFMIDTEGAVKNVELAKGIEGGELLNEEALRVIKLLPNWTPGYNNGKPVEVYYTLPISFNL